MRASTTASSNSSGYPIKYIQENCGHSPGDWITLKTLNEDGREIYAVGHRRGPAVHTFIAAHGTTLPGQPQAHKEDVSEFGVGVMLPRKCPRVLNEYTEAQPAIDVHNRYRQDILAIEEAHRTSAFPLRFLTFLFGLQFVNTYLACKHFYGDTRGCIPFLTELAYDLLTNDFDKAGGSPSGGSGGSGASSSSGSTAPSPHPMETAQDAATARPHRICSMRGVGWQGSQQLACVVCKAKTTTCCMDCSTSSAVVPICKPVHQWNGAQRMTNCLSVHAANPEQSRVSQRRPSPLMAPAVNKRARP